MEKTYVPVSLLPLNIDLHDYEKPKANKGVLKFSYFYLAMAVISLICYSLKGQVLFFAQYYILLEAMIAIFLFLSGKTLFSYLKEQHDYLKWNVTAGKIISIIEQDNANTLLKIEFYANNQDKMTVTEECRFKVIDEIKELNLNSLPVMYQPKRYRNGAYYVDLRFNNGKLDISNLKNITNR